MMFENFAQMFNFYRKRNIFNLHDFMLLEKGVVQSADDFWRLIVKPKYFLGRLNHGDVIRISAVLG